MEMGISNILVAIFFIIGINGEVFFEDRFSDGKIDKWIMSTHEKDSLGLCEFGKPKGSFDETEDGGIKTTQDARFYRYSAAFDKPLSSKDKTICVQYSVKHEQDIDCGGGYVKLLGESFKPEGFTGDSPYEIMFGPDICGYEKKMVHVIFSYKGQNHLVKKDISCKSDTLSHLYTLIVRPDNTFEVLIDRKSVQKGSLVDDFDMVPPKKIDDPEDKKPDDWVDDAQVPDPNEEKPDDWDQPKTIVDEKAKKPDDWDNETDGEWERPMIDNPAYKGVWTPKMIPNPDYKGEWKPRQIDNPEHVDDPEIYARTIAYIGLDLWQVKSGTIFDNFIVSDDVSECEKHGEYWQKRFDFEEEQAKKGGNEAVPDIPEPDSGNDADDEAEDDAGEEEEFEEAEESVNKDEL